MSSPCSSSTTGRPLAGCSAGAGYRKQPRRFAVGAAALRLLAERKAALLTSEGASASTAADQLADVLEARRDTVDFTGVLLTPTVVLALCDALTWRSRGRRAPVKRLILVDCGRCDTTAAALLARAVDESRALEAVVVGGATEIPEPFATRIQELAAETGRIAALRRRQQAARAHERAQQMIAAARAEHMALVEAAEEHVRELALRNHTLHMQSLRARMAAEADAIAFSKARAERLADVERQLSQVEAREATTRSSIASVWDRASLALCEMLSSALRGCVMRAEEDRRGGLFEESRFSWAFARRAERTRVQRHEDERQLVIDDEATERGRNEIAASRVWPTWERDYAKSRVAAQADEQRRLENAHREALARERVEALARGLKEREAAERAAHAEAAAKQQRTQREQLDAECLAERAALRDRIVAAHEALLMRALQDGVHAVLKHACEFRQGLQALNDAMLPEGSDHPSVLLRLSSSSSTPKTPADDPPAPCVWIGSATPTTLISKALVADPRCVASTRWIERVRRETAAASDRGGQVLSAVRDAFSPLVRAWLSATSDAPPTSIDGGESPRVQLLACIRGFSALCRLVGNDALDGRGDDGVPITAGRRLAELSTDDAAVVLGLFDAVAAHIETTVALPSPAALAEAAATTTSCTVTVDFAPPAVETGGRGDGAVTVTNPVLRQLGLGVSIAGVGEATIPATLTVPVDGLGAALASLQVRAPATSMARRLRSADAVLDVTLRLGCGVAAGPSALVSVPQTQATNFLRLPVRVAPCPVAAASAMGTPLPIDTPLFEPRWAGVVQVRRAQLAMLARDVRSIGASLSEVATSPKTAASGVGNSSRLQLAFRSDDQVQLDDDVVTVCDGYESRLVATFSQDPLGSGLRFELDASVPQDDRWLLVAVDAIATHIVVVVAAQNVGVGNERSTGTVTLAMTDASGRPVCTCATQKPLLPS